MAQYKKGGWGSVSTHFSPVRGYTSEAKRMSKSAEDKYQKDIAQLKTVQAVSSASITQAKSAAAMDEKTSAYEMKALANFSKTFNNFLTETVAKESLKQREKSIQKHMDAFERRDAGWEQKELELENQIAAAANNDSEKALLAEKLDKLIADRKLEAAQFDPTRLSGTEKIAYYAVKARNTVDNAEVNFYNYQEEIGGTTITSYNGQPILVKDITHPADRRTVKNMFLEKVFNDPDNQYGGLKDEYRVAFLKGPLKQRLDGLLANDIKHYNKDQAVQRIDARNQALINRINEIGPGYKDFDLIENELAAVINGNRRDYRVAEKGGGTQVLDDLYQLLETNMSGKKNAAEMRTAFLNASKLMKNVKVRGQDGKMTTLGAAYPNRFNLDKLTTAYATAANSLQTKKDNEAVGLTKGVIENFITQAESDIASGAKTIEQVIVEEKEFMNNLMKTTKNPQARVIIEAMRGDPRITYDKDKWLQQGRILARKWNGVIPEREVYGMPDGVRTDLQDLYGIKIVQEVPGAKNEDEVKVPEINVGLLREEIDAAERKFQGHNRKTVDTEAIDDLANDWYHKRLQFWMLGQPEGENLSHEDAAQRALQEVRSLIVDGIGNKIVSEGFMKGAENPFYSSSGDTAWTNNPNVATHKDNLLRLKTVNERQIDHVKLAEKTHSNKPYDPAGTWYWMPINAEDPTTYRHLGLPTAGGDIHPLMQARYIVVGKKGGNNINAYIRAQRIAALKSSGGGVILNSPLIQNAELMKYWQIDINSAEYEQQRVKAETSARKRESNIIQNEARRAGGGWI